MSAEEAREGGTSGDASQRVVDPLDIRFQSAPYDHSEGCICVYLFCGRDTSWVVDVDIPLMERRTIERRLPLLFGYTAVLRVGKSTSDKFE
jgi:hypothetical protein